MNYVYQPNPLVKQYFGDINEGECFFYPNEMGYGILAMKIVADENNNNAVRLDNGVLIHCDDNEVIKEIRARIVIMD